MIGLSFGVLFAYAVLQLFLLAGSWRLRFYCEPDLEEAHTRFSLVVPFRNEATHLPQLLKTIRELDYPRDLYELILVDDFSEDGSIAVIQQILTGSNLQWQLVPNPKGSGSPKKRAIGAAISTSKYPWILTTDADCELPRYGLRYLDCRIRANTPAMVCGPVALTKGSGFLHQFQSLENLALQLTTMSGFGWGRPMLCNGAHLAFKKEAFALVGGYAGNEELASGDDVFLLEKFQKAFPGKVDYLKHPGALVRTRPATSWKAFFSQRVRWASKTRKLKEPLLQITGILVVLVNAWLVAAFLYGLLLNPAFLLFYLALLVVKTLLDALLAIQAGRYLKVRIPWAYLLITGLLYPFVSSLVVLRSLRGGFNWKGRVHPR